ncbi:hypothetical protein HWV62_31421 [Athelia sp. TMB]|nr:hypothetical protein HWV62_31421 [Athelia sp. TMB]
MASTPSVAGPSTGPNDYNGDRSQLSRLLRHPNSTLSFASFDPTIAHTGGIKPTKNHQLENYRPKRIVIETSPEGASIWRFVPRARREEGVLDEGVWPRVVEVCGERIILTEDQWDIYKLDPAYDCLVPAPPRFSVITKAAPAPTSPIGARPGKRRPRSPLAESPQKRQRGRSVGVLTSSDEDSGDEDMPFTHAAGPRRSKSQLRDLQAQSRRARREKTLRAQAQQEQPIQDEDMFSPSEREPGPDLRGQSLPPGSASKRRKVAQGGMATGQPIIEEDDEDEDAVARELDPRAAKRTRTASPTSTRRTLGSKRAARERDKQARWSRLMASRKKDRERDFMTGIMEEVPTSTSTSYGSSTPQGTADRFESRPAPSTTPPEDPPETPITDEERARRAALEDSIRKLQELERDKPLWDEAAKQRRMRETAEEDEQRAAAERRRQAAAAQAARERRQQFEREEAEAQARADAERLEREAAAKRAQERRKQKQRWETGPWTPARALDRYRALCDAFDATKYSLNEPLTFADVPWPVLHAPGAFDVADIDWAAVEAFFQAVRPYVRVEEYKVFVEKSHRRFHPDRWRSRRILASVADEAEREELELAANVTAQALTPLWRDLK